MATELSPRYRPPEAYQSEFAHEEPGHLVEQAIVHDWEERGLPVRAATPEEDEKGSLRSVQGFDVLVSNVPIDLTTSFAKYERETLQPRGDQRERGKVVVQIPLGNKEFRGKTIEDILNNRQLLSDLSEATMRNLFLALPPKEAQQLRARLESSVLRGRVA